MSNRLHWFLLGAIVAFCACSKTPSWVIPEKEMEDLLFDIHLAESKIDNDYSQFNDSARKQKLFSSVFEKHGVTKADFDTSLVWYASKLEIYIEMYGRITDRYKVLKDTLDARLSVQNELENRPKRIWENDSVLVLRPFIAENIYTFRIDSNAYFASGDMYELNYVALGVNKSYLPGISFTWEGRDTCLVERTSILDNGRFTMYLKAIPGIKTTTLSGSIRLPLEAKGAQLVIHDLHLYRHKEGHHPEIKKPEPLVVDSAKTDSAVISNPLHKPEKADKKELFSKNKKS